jgi:cytochrome c556
MERTRAAALDLDDARRQADTIAAMLTAFPHLFPPDTNQWKPDGDPDPVADTLASPDIWGDFADFYQRAVVASKIAVQLGRAGNVDDFKTLTIELRVACDSCHALYLETP